MDDSKLKDVLKVWIGNNFGNTNNKLNCGWMKSLSTKGWWEVNHIRRETGPTYINIEVVQLTHKNRVKNSIPWLVIRPNSFSNLLSIRQVYWIGPFYQLFPSKKPNHNEIK